MIPGRQFAALQIQGDRPYQEDDFGCVNDREPNDPTPDSLLLVLADGMGGHAGGAHASQTAIKAFIERYRPDPGNEIDRLEESLEEANSQIKQATLSNPDLQGMGCTLVGALFMDEGLIWVSVGDSPVVPTGTRPLLPSAICHSTNSRRAFSSTWPLLSNGVTSAVNDPLNMIFTP